MTKSFHRQGFTIVETLVAVTILMIAVVGPLTAANRALTAANDAKNQMIAANLAQESIEFIRAYKDNNIQAGNYWLGSPGLTSCYGNLAATNQGNGATCGTTLVTATGQFTQSTCGTTECELFTDSNGDYVMSAAAGNIPTPFSRYIFLSSPVTVNGYESSLVTVVVKWGRAAGKLSSQPSYYNQLVLQETMTNAIRN